MSDAESSKPSVWSQLVSSRKAAIFALILTLIGFAAAGFILISLRSAWRGEMPIKDAMQMVFGTVIVGAITAAGLGWQMISAIKDEDVAKVNAAVPKAPMVQVASGENAIAQMGPAPATPPAPTTPSTADVNKA